MGYSCLIYTKVAFKRTYRSQKKTITKTFYLKDKPNKKITVSYCIYNPLSIGLFFCPNKHGLIRHDGIPMDDAMLESLAYQHKMPVPTTKSDCKYPFHRIPNIFKLQDEFLEIYEIFRNWDFRTVLIDELETEIIDPSYPASAIIALMSVPAVREHLDMCEST